MTENMRRFLASLVSRTAAGSTVTLAYAKSSTIGQAISDHAELAVFRSGTDEFGWPFIQVRKRADV